MYRIKTNPPENRRIPANLLQRLLHSRDIWQLRALALASMLAPLGVNATEVLEGDKDRVLAYLLRSGITVPLFEAGELTEGDLLDLWRIPIEGEDAT